MNPMDELKAARPAHLGDRSVDPHTRATELSRAMAGARQPRRGRRAVRPAWGLGLAGALAAATAAVVVVSANGPAPAPAPSAPASVASAPKVTLSARDVLLAAAGNAARQEDGSGAYWHSVSVSRSVFTAAEGGYQVVDQQRSESWTPRATGADQQQWSRSRSLGARPATEEDRQAWERAGSPAEIEVKVARKGAIVLNTSPGKAQSGHSPLVDGDKVFWLGRNVTMKDLLALPDDPDELKRWLLASYEGHDTESSSVPMARGPWLFRVSVGLIMDMPVTPEVRGAAFRMLADVDGVQVAQNVTDAEGRQGTAVSIEEPTQGGGVTEHRLVFDESTGRALASENVVVKARGLQAGLAPGTVSNSTALIEAGWTDTRS
ncbi:hypothetical protein FH608_032115 [Nonomuraea phyllanthi]|uniref:Uncharacterized protein n=1 Tax=Nonomuraea phyllanthi TaxID=2219224 RepID=A0A5C4VAY2_9ACTN|nr:CU044_5270 family protein [Nonomuraea phyllanthi]KAB8191243.1 hypothetical protein FH608_032115 [Nonomuraea phyllanthi]QFY12697.1 hypothetical protein GBF35_44495 [Nonomuraea phyllanthi]